MKSSPTKETLLFLTFLFILGINTLKAQPSFDDDVDDEPVASISDYTGVAFLLGTITACYILYKKKAA